LFEVVSVSAEVSNRIGKLYLQSSVPKQFLIRPLPKLATRWPIHQTNVSECKFRDFIFTSKVPALF
jgi:hypothetical protein